jgi:hypothetical protein
MPAGHLVMVAIMAAAGSVLLVDALIWAAGRSWHWHH